MNSIEIAQQLIDENENDVRDFRQGEKLIQKRIKEYNDKIAELESELEKFRRCIKMAEDDLRLMKHRIHEYSVDTLALKMFIANGGGLDMLD